MQNFRKMGALLGAGAVIFTLAGCSSKTADQASTAGDAIANTASSAAGDASNTASNAGAAVSNAASDAGAAISNTASNAGAAISNTASNAGAAISNTATGAANAVTGAGAAATITPKVKNALTQLSTGPLKGAVINVDTIADKKTVALRGTVKSAAQKTLAGATAKKNAGDFKIDNQLTVGK